MTDKLSIDRQQDNGTTILTLGGVMDEDAKLQRLEGVEGAVRINLKGVTAINSCGVREWVNAIRELEKNCSLEYVEVSVPIIQQFNMVLNARGKGRVLTFFAPYFCEACDQEMDRMLSPQDYPDNLGKPDALSAPDLNCEKCGGSLEFDDIPEKFFLFLETQLKEA